jgi:TolA-binding protein
MRQIARLTSTVAALALLLRALPAKAVDDAEYSHWKALIAQTAAKGGVVSDTTKILNQFLLAHPRGDHAPDVRFALGEAYFHDEQYQAASEQYQTLLRSSDGNYFGDSLLRLGEIAYNTKNFKAARENWQRVEDKVPGSSLLVAEALYDLTLCDLRDKDYLAADKKLDRLVRKFPTYANLGKTRELLGIIRFQEKNYAEARSYLEGLPTPTGAFYRGMSFFYQKQYLEAANSFNELESMSSGAYAELGSYFKAECFRMAQNASLAVQAYDSFIKQYPNSRLKLYALTQKASFLNRADRDAEALATLKQLKAMNPSKEVLAFAYYLEARIAAKKGENKLALSYIDQAIDILPSQMTELALNIQLAKVYFLLQGGHWAESGAVMQKMMARIAYNPIGIVAFMLSGQDAYLRRDWNNAATSYESALLKYPYNSLSDVAMAMLLSTDFQAGKFQELVTNSNRVVQVMDSQFTVQNRQWRAYSHFLIAESYYRLRLYPDASRYYAEAAKNPMLATQARLNLAWSRFHEEKFADSIALAQKVYGDPAAPATFRASALFLMGGSFFNQKNYEAAITTFRGFRAKFPQDPHVPESILQEGWAQRQSGFPGDAVAAWHSLGKLYPDNPMAQEAMLQVGHLYFAARDYRKAAKTFAEILARWPRSPSAADATWSMAQSYYNAEAFDEAVKEYRGFEARFPSDVRVADARNQVMLALYRQATITNDPKLLTNYVRLYPKSTQAPEAQYQLARDYFQQKKWAPATDEFRKLLLDYPGTSQAPSALFAVAQSQEFLGKPSEAIGEYESLLKLFPTSPLGLDAAMRLGAVYFNEQKFRDAARSFSFVIVREAPKEVKADAVYNAAVCFKKDRQYDEALRNLNLFATSFPEDSRITDVLLQTAAVNLTAGQPLKAADTYQKLLLRKTIPDTQRMEIYSQLGELYKTADLKDKSVESYEHLLTMSPLNADARLLGLVQLAALYEERESWEKALSVYNAIAHSHGKAEWVKAAAKRRNEIKAYLPTQRPSPAVAAASKTATAVSAPSPAASPVAATSLSAADVVQEGETPKRPDSAK